MSGSVLRACRTALWCVPSRTFPPQPVFRGAREVGVQQAHREGLSCFPGFPFAWQTVCYTQGLACSAGTVPQLLSGHPSDGGTALGKEVAPGGGSLMAEVELTQRCVSTA